MNGLEALEVLRTLNSMGATITQETFNKCIDVIEKELKTLEKYSNY